jgi:tetratricopeptide (TPR) repeat protein
LFRQLGDHTYVGFMLHNIGLIAYFQGDYARATALFEESLAIARAREDQGSVPITLGNLALVAVAQEQYDRATALQHEALSIGQHLSNRPWLARGVEHFALIAAATREPERAARLFGAAEAVRERFDAAVSPNDRDINARYMAIARDQIGEEAFAAAWAEGAAMSLHAAIAYALNGDEVSLSRKTSAGRTNR